MNITTSTRQKLARDLMDAIDEHFQYDALQAKEARAERIRLFDETMVYCENMKELEAKDLLFNKYSFEQIAVLYEEWENAG